MASFMTILRDFAQKPIGYFTIIALIVVFVALSLFETGIIFGALSMILLAFGIPVYIGWNKSFRTLLIVALVVTAATPPIWAALSNNELFTPYSPLPSGDGVLEGAHVTPFSYPPAKGNTYDFFVEAVKQTITVQVTVNGTVKNVVNGINITAVYLWVTNCPYDGTLYNATQLNNCGGNPDYFHETTYSMVKANYSRQVNPAWFNESLPGNSILYYMFVANYTLNKSGTYGFSCLPGPPGCVISHGVAVPAAQESYYWNEGPITGTWGYIYAARLLPTFYLITAGLGGILFAVVLVYRWLKIRERRRLEQAEASASGTPTEGEESCPACGAFIKKEESFCWKCGKPIDQNAKDGKDVKEGGTPLK